MKKEVITPFATGSGAHLVETRLPYHSLYFDIILHALQQIPPLRFRQRHATTEPGLPRGFVTGEQGAVLFGRFLDWKIRVQKLKVNIFPRCILPRNYLKHELGLAIYCKKSWMYLAGLLLLCMLKASPYIIIEWTCNIIRVEPQRLLQIQDSNHQQCQHLDTATKPFMKKPMKPM